MKFLWKTVSVWVQFLPFIYMLACIMCHFWHLKKVGRIFGNLQSPTTFWRIWAWFFAYIGLKLACTGLQRFQCTVVYSLLLDSFLQEFFWQLAWKYWCHSFIMHFLCLKKIEMSKEDLSCIGPPKINKQPSDLDFLI